MAACHSKPCYPIVDVFVRKPDDEQNQLEWEAFREKCKTTRIGASAVAGFIGSGYNSTSKSIEQHLSDE